MKSPREKKNFLKRKKKLWRLGPMKWDEMGEHVGLFGKWNNALHEQLYSFVYGLAYLI